MSNTNLKCERCRNFMTLFVFTAKDKMGIERVYADYIQCEDCGKIMIVPQDPVSEFSAFLPRGWVD